MRQGNKNIHQLTIGNYTFNSSLMLGTGKYRTFQDTIDSISISETSIVTVAIRRIHMKNQDDYNLLSTLKRKNIWVLPNTAGCTNVEEAIRIACLGKEINKRIGQIENNFIKLEVIPDPTYLLPDPIGTLKAAEYLVKKNFTVLAYTNTDPLLAKQLEEIGCSAVMPLGSPIGSGQGIQDPFNLSIIIKNSNIPIIIDAGISTASEASYAMELGADGVLMNTAIAQAASPQVMANSMKLAVQAGKYAYVAGRMQKQYKAIASSPTTMISV
uniref:Thiazole synthase n=1 Tax=Porolithon onkodes TaxID=231751 RepID=A0A2Z2KRN5_9FLOR|nr:thiamin biosynthesis protein G [Porolithon onkodes]ASB29626.1 thiamin biosynthesis protein G [Porolithon onkodes]